MLDDIVPTLLNDIQKKFDKKNRQNVKLKLLRQKLTDGVANYIDVNDYAVKLGELLSEVLQSKITSDVLPDGRMYHNIANRLLTPTLTNNYELITVYGEKVQQILNLNAGIHLKPQKPPLDTDKIDGFINRVSSEMFEDVQWLLGDPIVTYSQGIVDDIIESNAEFQYNSGLKPEIVRRSSGHCCDWCQKLVGIYSYPNIPKDVYRRHGNCRCTVEYDPKDGKKQNIWSKERHKTEKSKLTQLENVNTDTPYVSIKREWLKHAGKGSVIDMEYWEHDGVKYYVDGKHVVLDYSPKEKEVAEWFANKTGSTVKMVPRVNHPPNISSPDYLVNGLKFDLKEIKGSSEGTIDQNTRKAKRQAENIIYDVSQSKLTDYEVINQFKRIYIDKRRGLNIAVIKRDNDLVEIMKKRPT